MAKTDDKVMAVVEKELEKNPDASVQDLYDKAKSVKSAIGKLTLRQFNARYPLQVKRKKSTRAPGKGKRQRATRKRGRGAANGGDRDKVRQALLRFAGDVAGAEERKELVQVLSNVDRYVDEVMKAAG